MIKRLNEKSAPKHRKDKTKFESTTDELINTLSNSKENKRARQVFEWEFVRRNLRRQDAETR